MLQNHRVYTLATSGFLLLVTASFTPQSVAADAHYVGTAYANDSHAVLYKEEHFVFDNHGQRTRLVLYRCPSGEPFARKWVHDIAGAEAPNFDLVDARTGYREGVLGKPGARTVYTQAGDHATVHFDSLPDRPNEVIDAGFDAYVRQHWDALGINRKTSVAFVVPSRLGYVDLRLADADKGTMDGQSIRRLRLSMDAWYGFAAPAIDLTYDSVDRRLLRFEGISNIRDASGKNQRVIIQFPRSAELATPGLPDIQKAASVALVTHCPP
jgi:hypothetical protein